MSCKCSNAGDGNRGWIVTSTKVLGEKSINGIECVANEVIRGVNSLIFVTGAAAGSYIRRNLREDVNHLSNASFHFNL